MKVEHWRAQSGGEDRLRWSNLLGVCLGDAAAEDSGDAAAGAGPIIDARHCDTAGGRHSAGRPDPSAMRGGPLPAPALGPQAEREPVR